MGRKRRTERSLHEEPRSKGKSRIRRLLNLRLLIATLVFLAIAVGGSYAWHAIQVARTARDFLQRAGTLEAEGQSAEAEGRPADAAARYREAADYLSRYLELNPTNKEAQVRLAEIFDRWTTRAPGKGEGADRTIELYYEALGLTDDPKTEARLRRRLAELLLEQGIRLAAAEDAQLKSRSRRLLVNAVDQAKQLPNDTDNSRGWSVLALGLYLQKVGKTSPPSETGQWAPNSIGAAFAPMGQSVDMAFLEALCRNPGQVDLAMTCARYFRKEQPLLSLEVRAPREARR